MGAAEELSVSPLVPVACGSVAEVSSARDATDVVDVAAGEEVSFSRVCTDVGELTGDESSREKATATMMASRINI